MSTPGAHTFQIGGREDFQAFDAVGFVTQGQSVFVNQSGQLAIPEPGSLALLGLGGLAVLGRRRHA